MNLPANLPSVSNARLPASYEGAKTALAQCEKLDECKEWGDRMAALASYAKQANDETMLNMAHKIRARAIRRMGEVMKEIEPSPGRPAKEITTGTGSNLTRTQAARDAGLSPRQQAQAMRLANIPADEFEKAVESDKPPTINDLEEAGTRKRIHEEIIADKLRETPEQEAAWSIRCDLYDFYLAVEDLSPEMAAKNLRHDPAEAIAWARHCAGWLSRYIQTLENRQ